MPETSVISVDPVSLIASYGLINIAGSRAKKKEFRDAIANSTDAQRLDDVRTKVIIDLEALPTKGLIGQVAQKAGREVIGLIDSRLDQLEQQGETPDDDYAGPIYDPEPSPAYDQEPSPNFGTPAILGVGSGIAEAARKGVYILEQKQARAIANKKELEFYKKVAKQNKNALKVKGTTVFVAKRMLSIAAKQFPGAAKAIKKGAKAFRGVKVGKVGGLAGMAVSIGGQLGIEKISEVLKQRQFAEMERILKRQQVETNKVVDAVRKGKAAGKTSVPPKAPPKTRQVQSKAVGSSPTMAPKPVAQKIEPARPNPVKTAPKSIWTPPKATIGKTPVLKRVLQQFQTYSPLLSLLSQERNKVSSATFAPAFSEARTSTRTQTSFSGLSRLGGTTSGELCPCPKPRKKSDKKRKQPRVCVSKDVAKKAGIFPRGK